MSRKTTVALAFFAFIGLAYGARKLGTEIIGVQQMFWEDGSGLPVAVSTVAPMPIQGSVTASGTVTVNEPVTVDGTVSITGLANPLPVTTPASVNVTTSAPIDVTIDGPDPLPVRDDDVNSTELIVAGTFQLDCTSGGVAFPTNSAIYVCYTSMESAGGNLVFVGKTGVTVTTGDVLHPTQPGCDDVSANTNELSCRVVTTTVRISGKYYTSR